MALKLCYFLLLSRKSNFNVCTLTKRWLRLKSSAPVRLGSIRGGEISMRKILVFCGVCVVVISTFLAGVLAIEQYFAKAIMHLIFSMFGWILIFKYLNREGG